MAQTHRIIGWSALLAGFSYLVQPFVVALAPSVFGTSKMVTDPAVLHSASWFGAIECAAFLGVAIGMGLVAIGIDELLGTARSVMGRAHFLVGVAAAFGWLLVAAASVARYSTVVSAASAFGDEGRSVFFQAQALDITTGVFVASLAAGIWWIATAVRGARASLLGRPLAAFAGIVGALVVLPNLMGIPWGALLQIPLFIVFGIAFLRRRPGVAPAAASREALGAV